MEAILYGAIGREGIKKVRCGWNIAMGLNNMLLNKVGVIS